MRCRFHHVQKQIALNFDTAYHVARPLLKHFKEQGSGSLVFVGARPALDPQAGKNMIAYALSKSLLFQLAEYINAEHKGTDITASVIVPSTIDTPRRKSSWSSTSSTRMRDAREVTRASCHAGASSVSAADQGTRPASAPSEVSTSRWMTP